MNLSEVFRPTNGGDLLVRDNMAQGPPQPLDPLRQSRPATQGGYRFGQLSHHSFFTRHNPHPQRVRHLKGLLNVPICSVNDDGYFANPRYSLQFPPNSFNTSKLSHWKTRIPVNSVHLNSQLHPINIITGLQHFTGLHNYPFRERAIPRVGLVPVTEAWRDELKRFTQLLGLEQAAEDNAMKEIQKQEDPRPRTTKYSPETGRLIPPSSRALSRAASKRSKRERFFGNFQYIAPEPDIENMVLVMLCQILQTEDINAVQAWLCSAGDREKSMVMDLIQAALAGREEYYKQYPSEMAEHNPLPTKLPPILNAQSQKPTTGEINRLVLEDRAQSPPTPLPSPVQQTREDKTEEASDFQPPSNEVFRISSPSKKVQSQMGSKSPTIQPLTVEEASTKPTQSAHLRHTKPPIKESNKETPDMWRQSESVNTF